MSGALGTEALAASVEFPESEDSAPLNAEAFLPGTYLSKPDGFFRPLSPIRKILTTHPEYSGGFHGASLRLAAPALCSQVLMSCSEFQFLALSVEGFEFLALSVEGLGLRV